MKKLLVLFAAMMIITNAFIFFNSFQSSEESNSNSQKVQEVVEPVVQAVVGKEARVNMSSFVRKSAHIVEFALLGAFCAAFVAIFKSLYKKNVLGYFLFYVLFSAVIDEYIQSFNYRTSQVEDVLIDFSGADGNTCYFAYRKSIRSLKEKKNSL